MKRKPVKERFSGLDIIETPLTLEILIFCYWMEQSESNWASDKDKLTCFGALG